MKNVIEFPCASIDQIVGGAMNAIREDVRDRVGIEMAKSAIRRQPAPVIEVKIVQHSSLEQVMGRLYATGVDFTMQSSLNGGYDFWLTNLSVEMAADPFKLEYRYGNSESMEDLAESIHEHVCRELPKSEYAAKFGGKEAA